MARGGRGRMAVDNEFQEDIPPAERRRLIDGFERAARELKERAPHEAEQPLFTWEDVVGKPDQSRRPAWLVRLRIDSYAYARGFLACGFPQFLRSCLGFFWPRRDSVHPRFVRALVCDEPHPAKPAELSLTRTLLEMRRSAEFLSASDHFLRRTTDEHSAFRAQLRKELETWEPFGLAVLSQHAASSDDALKALSIIRSRFDRGAAVDVFDLPVVVRFVCRTVLSVSAHPAEVREAVYSVANLAETLYRRVYGSRDATRLIQERLKNAAQEFAACRTRLEWFAVQCYPLLLKMIGAFAEQPRAYLIRDQILAFLELDRASILKPERKPVVREAPGAEAREQPEQKAYRTDIQEYTGVVSMLAHTFPGIGMERVLEGDYSSFPAFVERFGASPGGSARKGKGGSYEELLRRLSHRDPLAPVIMLHRVVEVMLESVDVESMSRLVDPAEKSFAEVRDLLADLRLQWTAVREELFPRYVQEVDQFGRESVPPRDPDDAMAAVARRRAAELVNQIRNHVVWGYGYIEREVNRQHYFRCRPLYNLADELFALLRSLHPGRSELERGNPVLLDRLRSNLFLRFGDGPIPAHIRGYSEAVAKVKPVLAERSAETHRVFMESLVGTVDLLDHLLNDPHTPLRTAGSQVLVSDEVDERLRTKPQDGPADVRDGLRRDFGGVDELTGLRSKNEYLRSMPELFRQARQNGQELSFLLLDIDRFKVVNDTQGHDFGDRVLTTIAGAVRSSLREEDMAVRFGGEEILVVFRGNYRDAAQQAERIRKACQTAVTEGFGAELKEIAVTMGTQELKRRHGRSGLTPERLEPFVRKWLALPVATVSVGVAQGLGRAMARPCADEGELFRIADRMLYCAKESGRNRVVLMSEDAGIPLGLDEHEELAAFMAEQGSSARTFIGERAASGRPLRFSDVDARASAGAQGGRRK